MILLVLAAVCVLSVPITGGRLRRLAHVRVRWVWLGPVAVSVQTVLVTIAPGGSETVHASIHIGTYALLAAFLWANRHLPGARIIACGTFMNGLAITVNGGVMPASAAAQRVAGLTLGKGFHNSVALAHPHLLWLGDIIPVPWPLPNVLSAGDCIVFIGLLFLLHRTCRASDPERELVRVAVNPPSSPGRSRRPGAIAVAADDVYRARVAAAAQWLADVGQLPGTSEA